MRAIGPTPLALGLSSLLLLAGTPVLAQAPPVYRISQRAVVTQSLANDTITVQYSRPGARGRSPLFGNVVHFGEVWTPGANEATVLELSGPATIEGHEVPAGRWSVWMIPSEVSAWELLLHPEDSLFHTQRPQVGAPGQIAFDVRDESGEPVELLTFDFPDVDRNRATLRMRWGRVVVPLEIEVAPNLPETTVTESQASRYAGEWTMTMAELPPGAPEGAELPPAFPVTIERSERSHLVILFPTGFMAPPATATEDGEPATARERERAEGAAAAEEQLAAGDWYYNALVHFAEGIFRIGFFLADGTLVDVDNVFFEFEFPENGPADVLLIRGPEDQVIMRGERGGGPS